MRETEVCTRTRKRQRGLIRGAAGDSPSEEDQDFHQLAKDLLLLQDLPGEGRGLKGEFRRVEGRGELRRG